MSHANTPVNHPSKNAINTMAAIPLVELDKFLMRTRPLHKEFGVGVLGYGNS